MNADPLNATLHDASELLKGQGIAFALIDGLAVAVRGEPRSTLDVDIFIDCDVEHDDLLGRLTELRNRSLSG